MQRKKRSCHTKSFTLDARVEFLNTEACSTSCHGLYPPRTHIEDGPVAVVAARGEEVVIVLLAVGLPIPLKEVP